MDMDERRVAGLDFLLDYSKGTIWWGDNRPGLSIARRKASGLYDIVPMLIGTSKRHCRRSRSLEISRLSSEASPHHGFAWCFATLRPRSLRFDGVGKAYGISMNDYKPGLDRDESRMLDEMLAQKEVRHG